MAKWPKKMDHPKAGIVLRDDQSSSAFGAGSRHFCLSCEPSFWAGRARDNISSSLYLVFSREGQTSLIKSCRGCKLKRSVFGAHVVRWLHACLTTRALIFNPQGVFSKFILCTLQNCRVCYYFARLLNRRLFGANSGVKKTVKSEEGKFTSQIESYKWLLCFQELD